MYRRAVTLVVLALSLCACPLAPGHPDLQDVTPAYTPSPHPRITSVVLDRSQGPPLVFCAYPHGGSCLALSHIATAIPPVLPNPVTSQAAGCTWHDTITFSFADGSNVRYGPCGVPEAVDRVRRAMLDFIDGGPGAA